PSDSAISNICLTHCLWDSLFHSNHSISLLQNPILPWNWSYQVQYLIDLSDRSVVGTSFATIPVATGAFTQWYANGTCPTDASGNKLPCPDGYGAILGTACVCSLL